MTLGEGLAAFVGVAVIAALFILASYFRRARMDVKILRVLATADYGAVVRRESILDEFHDREHTDAEDALLGLVFRDFVDRLPCGGYRITGIGRRYLRRIERA